MVTREARSGSMQWSRAKRVAAPCNGWRRERDSNPRCPLRQSGFQDRLFQPLTHPSAWAVSSSPSSVAATCSHRAPWPQWFAFGVVPVSPGADGLICLSAFSAVREFTRVSPCPAVAGFSPPGPLGVALASPRSPGIVPRLSFVSLAISRPPSLQMQNGNGGRFLRPPLIASPRTSTASAYGLVEASTFSSIFTSSPKAASPLLSVPFQFRPKSLRLIVVVAVNPRTSDLPSMSTCSLPGASIVSVTGFVTPCSVRSPVTRYPPAPFCFTPVLLNVIVGYFATSKKSALFRCVSRAATPVSTVVTSIVAFTAHAP